MSVFPRLAGHGVVGLADQGRALDVLAGAAGFRGLLRFPSLTGRKALVAVPTATRVQVDHVHNFLQRRRPFR
mgnify:CR=1 FL=1